MKPKPQDVSIPDDKVWEEMSAELRHYYRNKSEWVGRIGQRKQELIEWVRQIEVDRGCADCSEDHPACTQWHHVSDDKDRTPMRMAREGCSKDNIRLEMEKCVVVCANCHAKRHWNNRKS